MMEETYSYREGDWYIVPMDKFNTNLDISLNSVLVHDMDNTYSAPHRHYVWNYYDLKAECEFCDEQPPKDITTLWVLENMDTKHFMEFM